MADPKLSVTIAPPADGIDADLLSVNDTTGELKLAPIFYAPTGNSRLLYIEVAEAGKPPERYRLQISGKNKVLKLLACKPVVPACLGDKP